MTNATFSIMIFYSFRMPILQQIGMPSVGMSTLNGNQATSRKFYSCDHFQAPQFHENTHQGSLDVIFGTRQFKWSDRTLATVSVTTVQRTSLRIWNEGLKPDDVVRMSDV